MRARRVYVIVMFGASQGMVLSQAVVMDCIGMYPHAIGRSHRYYRFSHALTHYVVLNIFSRHHFGLLSFRPI